MKKIYSTSLLILPIFLIACVSGNKSVADVPDWVRQYPFSADYYTGVAFSPTSQSGYQEVTFLKALTELASQISVRIESESEVISTGSADESNTTFSQRVTQLIVADLERVEVVDEYISPNGDYYIYVRLSREEWERQVSQKREELKIRVASLLASLDDSNMSLTQRFNTLSQARQLVMASPYSNSFLMSFGPLSATPLDIVNHYQSKEFANLTIDINNPGQVTIGEKIPIEILVRGDLGQSTGQLLLEIHDIGNEFETVLVTTNESGEFSGNLDLGGNSTGLKRFSVVPSGLSGIIDNFWIFEVSITKIPLVVTSDIAVQNAGVEDRFLDLLRSRSSLYDITESPATTAFELELSLSTFEYPPTDITNFRFVETWINIAIRKNNVEIANFTSDKVKEGGLTIEQAIERSITSQLEALSQDQRFAETLNIFR
jgi:hypothetical protein